MALNTINQTILLVTGEVLNGYTIKQSRWRPIICTKDSRVCLCKSIHISDILYESIIFKPSEMIVEHLVSNIFKHCLQRDTSCRLRISDMINMIYNSIQLFNV